MKRKERGQRRGRGCVGPRARTGHIFGGSEGAADRTQAAEGAHQGAHHERIYGIHGVTGPNIIVTGVGRSALTPLCPKLHRSHR
jgi:hypothetical protein